MGKTSHYPKSGSDAGLRLKSVVKRYNELVVVDHVNLDVAPGEFVVFLGPSGCGKTTTLRMIAGFQEVSDGEISLDERVLSTASRNVKPEKRDMGMMFQSYALWPHMTVFENVAYRLRVKRMPKDAIVKKVGAALETVRMGALQGRYPSELSGGQQQRVALARAIAGEPKLLLMDEPLSNLDAKLRREMRFELWSLHQRLRFTAVYVTHDQTEAITLADRIVVLDAGRIQQIGTPEDLYLRPSNMFVASFLGQMTALEGVTSGTSVVDVGGARFGYTSQAPLPSGSRVIAVLRPRDLEVLNGSESGSAGPEEENVLICKVVSALFTGDGWDCVLHVPTLGVTIDAELPPYVLISPEGNLRCRVRCLAVVQPS